MPPVQGKFGAGSGLDTLLAILGEDAGFAVWGDSDVGSGIVGSSDSKEGCFGLSRNGTGMSAISIQQSAMWASAERSFGLYAESSGEAFTSGVHGESFKGTGVSGRAIGVGAGPGVVGLSDGSFGVRGQSGAADLLPPVGGGPEFQICGVQGSSDNGTGVRGDSAKHVGVRGRSFLGDGVFGSCSDQPRGPQTTGNGIHGRAPRSSPDANTGPFAGLFDGDVKITGNLFLGNTLVPHGKARQFQQVVFGGIATLNAKGAAVVALPVGLGDIEGEFCYQLTSIGGAAPNLHVAEEVRRNKFKIAGGAGKSRVSWQVSATISEKPVSVENAGEQIDKKEAKRLREQMDAFEKQIKINKSRSPRKS